MFRAVASAPDSNSRMTPLAASAMTSRTRATTSSQFSPGSPFSIDSSLSRVTWRMR
ncbi:hypothetical protein D3C83_315060 [compost metagenome]